MTLWYADQRRAGSLFGVWRKNTEVRVEGTHCHFRASMILGRRYAESGRVPYEQNPVIFNITFILLYMKK